MLEVSAGVWCRPADKLISGENFSARFASAKVATSISTQHRDIQRPTRNEFYGR